MELGVVADRLRLADDDKPAVAGIQDLDGSVVELRQRLGPDHIARRAGEHAAAGDVDHAIDELQDRVDVVGDEQDCDPPTARKAAHELRDRLLVLEAEPHQIRGADAKVGVEVPALRQVADGVVAAPHRAPEDRGRALAQGNHAKQRLEQRRLAGAVGAQDGDELAFRDLEVDAAPDGATAEADRRAVELDRQRHAQEYCTTYLRKPYAINCSVSCPDRARSPTRSAACSRPRSATLGHSTSSWP